MMQKRTAIGHIGDVFTAFDYSAIDTAAKRWAVVMECAGPNAYM